MDDSANGHVTSSQLELPATTQISCPASPALCLLHARVTDDLFLELCEITCPGSVTAAGACVASVRSFGYCTEYCAAKLKMADPWWRMGSIRDCYFQDDQYLS